MACAQPDGFRAEELLADVIAGLIGDAHHAAIGASSPIPAAAALLARERGNGRPQVSLLGSRRQSFFTDGGRELFDCAGQGRIDVFFLSGGQIDGEANINLVGIGDYKRPKARFPGSFGASYLYYVVPRVILFRLEHSRRTLVEKVDFVSAPGTSPSIVPAARSRSSPAAACSPSTAAGGAFASRAFIPGTRRPRSARTPALHSTCRSMCR
jgi:glutaconate CoA-transferase subunit B